MKVLSKEHYKYLGEWGLYHAFQCTKKEFNPEIVLEVCARVVDKEGRSQFFDPIRNGEDFDLSCVRNHLTTAIDVSLPQEEGKVEYTRSDERARYKRLVQYSVDELREGAASRKVV